MVTFTGVSSFSRFSGSPDHASPSASTWIPPRFALAASVPATMFAARAGSKVCRIQPDERPKNTIARNLVATFIRIPHHFSLGTDDDRYWSKSGSAFQDHNRHRLHRGMRDRKR